MHVPPHSGDSTITCSLQHLARQCLNQNHRQGTRHHRRRHPCSWNTPPLSACRLAPASKRLFAASRVTKLLTKFNWALSKLPFSPIDSMGLLCKHLASYLDLYQKLQDILLRSYGLSASQRMGKWWTTRVAATTGPPSCGTTSPPCSRPQ
jgi:hypothetical protein